MPRRKSPEVLVLPKVLPRNPIAQALVAKRLSVGTGKHQKSTGAQRQAAKKALQAALVTDLRATKNS